jgi:hypothetical protein
VSLYVRSKFDRGEKTRVPHIQHIQKLALQLSQERDPKKITRLIDEIRDAAAAYIEATPNQGDSQSAAGGA